MLLGGRKSIQLTEGLVASVQEVTGNLGGQWQELVVDMLLYEDE